MIRKATVFGGGLIGSGWATSFLLGGLDVTVYDINAECLANTRRRIAGNLARLSAPENSVLPSSEVEPRLNSVCFTSNAKEGVAQAEFIQENGPENLEIKRSMIAAIEDYNADAIIATSTSGLKVTDIAATAKNKGRILAGHPFNPVHLMPLVEVCKGDCTEDWAVEKAVAFYSQIRKVPVVLREEVRGFICNRLQAALNREVQDLVYRNICSVEDIDKAVTFGLGMRLGLIGPHMIFELAGGDGGIESCLTKFNTKEEMFKDLADWTIRPEGYQAVAVAGAKEELQNRPARMGADHEGLEKFRDAGLIKLLKYHELI